MNNVGQNDTAKRVVITFVNDEAGLFIHSVNQIEENRIMVGGVALNRTVVELAIVQTLMRLVREQLGVKLEGEKRGRRPSVIAGPTTDGPVDRVEALGGDRLEP